MDENVYQEIRDLSNEYMNRLKEQVDNRIKEMEYDDTSHYLIYRVLGVSNKEGKLIDEYQNKGRFLYKYAGSFLEEATLICIQHKYPAAQKYHVENNISSRPKRFEIDCLVGNDAIEIKWRDATTDGDHITKEHTRLQCIRGYGYKPIRIMFYYPQREQAQRIQDTIATIYNGCDGEYYFGDAAWEYVERLTGINLLDILERIANERELRD